MITPGRARPLEAAESGLAREIREKLGIDIARCLECGKCSGGCSNADGFDYTPRKMVQLIKLGERETLLRMQALWTCLACQLCLDRCPSGIDTPRILDYLRSQARLEGKEAARPEIEKFYELMLEDIRRHGRIGETALMLRYNLATGRWLQNAGLGWKLLRKGKLRLCTPGLKNPAALRPLFKGVL